MCYAFILNNYGECGPSLSYNAGPLYLAVAQDSYENGGNAESDSLTRVVGTDKMGGMQLGLL